MTDQQPPSAAAPSPPRRRLTRSTDDRIVAGVAGGLGRYFDVDPVVFRIGLVVAAFMGGAGVLGYLAAWLLVPEDETPATGAEDPSHDGRQRDGLFWVGIALLVMAGFAIADDIGFGDSGWLVPFLLIGIGVALWRSSATARQDRARSRTDLPAPGAAGVTHASPADDHDTDVMVRNPGTTAASSELVAPAPTGGVTPTGPTGRSRSSRWRQRREARRRSYLGRLTVGVALVVSGLAAVLNNAGVLDLTLGEVLAVDLAIVGLGLVVGTWYGRSRGLIVLGIVLTPIALFTSVLGDVPLGSGGAGERNIVVTEVANLDAEYTLGTGRMELDLSQLDLEGRDVHVDVRVGAGEVVVHLPAGAGYVVDANVRIGQLTLPDGRHDQGFHNSRRITAAGGDGTLRLDVRLGVGSLELYAPATARDDAAATAVDASGTNVPPPAAFRSTPRQEG